MTARSRGALAPGADDGQRPVERPDAVGQPAQARAPVGRGAADAVVAHLDHQRRPLATVTRTVAAEAWAYLATFVSASATTK